MSDPAPFDYPPMPTVRDLEGFEARPHSEYRLPRYAPSLLKPSAGVIRDLRAALRLAFSRDAVTRL